MAWGTYMLRSSFVSVFVRLRVMARAAHGPMHPCIHAISPNTPITHLPISPSPHNSRSEYAEWLGGNSLSSTICRTFDTYSLFFLQPGARILCEFWDGILSRKNCKASSEKRQ
jgi:hypothetical protein